MLLIENSLRLPWEKSINWHCQPLKSSVSNINSSPKSSTELQSSTRSVISLIYRLNVERRHVNVKEESRKRSNITSSIHNSLTERSQEEPDSSRKDPSDKRNLIDAICVERRAILLRTISRTKRATS